MESPVIQQLTIGAGTVGPTPDQFDQADNLAKQLMDGAFFVPADGSLICRCIDERLCEYHQLNTDLALAPNAAGGSMSLVVGDMLIDQRITGTGTTAERLERMLNHLVQLNLAIGGHTDSHDHATDVGSGCGACDKLAAILAFMAENLDTIRGFIEDDLGIEVSEAIHETVRTNLQTQLEFSHGAELLTVLVQSSDKALVEKMIGTHEGIVAVVNLVNGTTLDRRALSGSTDGLTAFNIDAWAFLESAKQVWGNDAEAYEKMIAMAYYNVATSGVLCGPTMRLVIRRS